ncbi:hypothetical protein MKD41_07280 [Lutibacter sp. A64]|uniref:hypothetical protein n=1 Tax=Lutibacter sp. A64 TaxID=2918526 RepID=UPI001F061CEC|nr:hypothetical protein [Lutibacter sp. A64]UMB55267.1 hypothetical protein MKD41_07280 [Lutibacter sp. A64]
MFLIDQISYYQPGIFGIQRRSSASSTFLDSILVGYNYIGVGRDDGKVKGENSAIFYNSKKFKVSVEKYAVLSDSKDCKYPSDHLPVFIKKINS